MGDGVHDGDPSRPIFKRAERVDKLQGIFKCYRCARSFSSAAARRAHSKQVHGSAGAWAQQPHDQQKDG